jgi:Caspase domain
MSLRAVLLAGLVLLCLSNVCAAQRFAVVIGNNVGHAGDAPLQFAERDATRVADVLTSVGAVQPDQLILAQGATAKSARRSLIAMNERIRAQASATSMLVVYYSGHGDAESLHLGGTSLPMSELEGLVRGSAARVRILIIDACRSGALVRAKGGRAAPSIRIRTSAFSGDGVVLLTATAAGEDAHESPSLEGSFSTHHLLSGLLGAADGDADGGVTITEAYNYAYANTLRDSSATLQGPQHPSYHYDLRGQGDVVLTEVRSATARAQFVVPTGLSVLVMRGSATGSVIAEARTTDDKIGTLSLPPGRVFIRARTQRELYEQQVTLRAGQTFHLDTAAMDRIDFTRLARKGGSFRPSVTGVGLAVTSHRGISDALAYCSGASVHAAFVVRSFSLVPRLGMCRESFQVDRYDSATTETQTSFAFNVHHDVARKWSAYIGPEIAVSYFRQTVTAPAGTEISHNVFGGSLAVQGGVELAFGNGYAVGVRALAQTYFVELQNPSRVAPQVSAVFAWGASLGVTRYLR